jgi:N6-adenosine-specific RNA methylase IME4
VTRYRTIVADPPWPIGVTGVNPRRNEGRYAHVETPYNAMSLDEIARLPVRDLSVSDYFGSDRKALRDNGLPSRDGSHLFLWATTSTLEAAHDVARDWRFSPSSVLVWCKEPRGFSVGGLFQANVEFVVYARRGSPRATGTCPSRWFRWPRSAHSQKPEAFLDLVESICPGPYLELFARRRGNSAVGNRCGSRGGLAAILEPSCAWMNA